MLYLWRSCSLEPVIKHQSDPAESEFLSYFIHLIVSSFLVWNTQRTEYNNNEELRQEFWDLGFVRGQFENSLSGY